MKPFAPFALALALTACTSGERPRGPRFNTAQPGEVIAAELAFARLAQERGQWTAFRETHAEGAELFVPQRVLAQDWLRGRADPARSVTWQPHAVWSSCDGSYAVTRGRWQNISASGAFVTVWQRQQRGGYKWVLDMSLTDDQADPTPNDTIAAKVATCPTGIFPAPPPRLVPTFRDTKLAMADDSSLRWTSIVLADGSREIGVEAWNGSNFDEVLHMTGNDTD